ncbi:MAG: hypothetical protein KDB90_00625 [Planctomycetes bacterium]|nr:hypothetical protein [Planctomycetota bacterium]
MKVRQKWFPAIAVLVLLALAAVWLILSADGNTPVFQSGTACGSTRSRLANGSDSTDSNQPAPLNASSTNSSGSGSVGKDSGTGKPAENDEERWLSDPPEVIAWNPDDFTNTRLAWRSPRARLDAARPKPQNEYLGTPVFLDVWAYRQTPKSFGMGDFFDPMQPDGMLAIRPRWVDHDQSMGWRKGSIAEATSHDGALVYTSDARKDEVAFVIPYSYRRSDIIGLRITGPNMLPVEAVIGQAGCVRTHGGLNSLRHQILVTGEARPRLRVFPVDYADVHQILVRNVAGRPVSGAMLTCDGVQILGRSSDIGVLRYPWPSELVDVGEHDKIQEKFFVVSAPGYVPVLLERSALEDTTNPIEVTLKARELLVSVWETLPHPEVLKLGANERRESVILDAGFDLIPVPEEWPDFNDWSDVHKALIYGFQPAMYDRRLAKGDIHLDDFFNSYQTRGTGPFEPGHTFGDQGACKLAEAIGQEPTEHWPEYARWYYGRWNYDESEGRFDVVLPFPGRFLLAVGEYNHGVKSDQRNGKLTHALYIDARNPAELKSKLLVHPQG